jgi:hypothetical protein
VVLPVHDSFLVHPAMGDFLWMVMDEALRQVLGPLTSKVSIDGSVPRLFLDNGMNCYGPTPYDFLEDSDRLYPWGVDPVEYSLFFELWRASGRNVDAERSRALALHRQTNKPTNAASPTTVA